MQAFKKLVTCKDDVAGLPASALGLAAQQAQKEGHPEASPEGGPWLLTLDYPCYQPVLTHCKNRALREEMYRCGLGGRAGRGGGQARGVQERGAGVEVLGVP